MLLLSCCSIELGNGLLYNSKNTWYLFLTNQIQKLLHKSSDGTLERVKFDWREREKNGFRLVS